MPLFSMIDCVLDLIIAQVILPAGSELERKLQGNCPSSREDAREIYWVLTRNEYYDADTQVLRK
jgi:hypothetical protein